MSKKKDISQLEPDFKRLEAACKDPRHLQQAAQFVEGAAKLAAPGGTSGFLRNSIGYAITDEDPGMVAHIGANAEYAMYVEFGTGPKGAANHSGVSPDYKPVYRLEPWWVHESQIDPQAIEKYNWPSIVTENGRFFKISGQAAQPFLYPSLKNNEEKLGKMITEGIMGALGK